MFTPIQVWVPVQVCWVTAPWTQLRRYQVDRTLSSEMSHLEVIKQWVSEALGLSKIFQVRINPDGSRPMFRRRKASNGEQVWQVTEPEQEEPGILFPVM